MLETSKDVLFLVIALCVFIVTVFFVWIMYYIAQILKSSKEMVEEIKNKVEEFGNLLTTVKDKITHSTTVLTAVAKGVTDLSRMFKDKRGGKDDVYEDDADFDEDTKKTSKRKRRK